MPERELFLRFYGVKLTAVDSVAHRVGMAIATVDDLTSTHWEGRVSAASENGAEIIGLAHNLSIGDRLNIHGRYGTSAIAEVISVRSHLIYSMCFSKLDGLGAGVRASASLKHSSPGLTVSFEWLGRVVDPFGRPLDGHAAPSNVQRPRPTRVMPPDATRRARLGNRMSLGVRALDLFTTCRHGQRIGLFAAAGVGKSSLLAMLARNAACDICVIALVGERGKEVREFLEDELGEIGRSRSVIVVATSDSSPLLRREAAYAAMTISEYFRDCGQNVLLLMDSITRFCHALREIALAAGEPPASRGYPPTVFAELPRLLERAGPGLQLDKPPGLITAFFTVLVEADDHNDPVADSARGLLDGHVILERRIAEQGRFPAVNVLRSLSRAVPGCNTDAENQLIQDARKLISNYADASELIRLGAYRSGADPAMDKALSAMHSIENILRQGRNEYSTCAESFSQLEILIKSMT